MLSTEDHLGARDALVAMFFAADRHAWAAVRAYLAETLSLDYTSLNGGEPASVSADGLVEAWKAFLPGFDVTHHQLSVVSSRAVSNGIEVVANGTATHRLASVTGESLWTIAGYYTAVLGRAGDRWVISSLVFTCTWGSGNRELVREAQARAAAQAPPRATP